MSHADHGSKEPHPTETLAATTHGRVARCLGCGSLELRFGNALLRMDATDLPRVHAAIAPSLKQNDSRHADAHSSSPRTIEIYMGDSGAGFAFTYAEIVELSDLLASAELRLGDSAIDPEIDDADDDIIPEAIRRRLNGGFSRGRA